MSDEELRRLERRVEASPTDFSLGHELIAGLERAGETHRAREELVRLARLGDARAGRRLARMAPPAANRFDAGLRDGVTHPERAREKALLLELSGPRVPFVALDRAIVFEAWESLVWVDPRELTERRTAKESSSYLRCADSTTPFLAGGATVFTADAAGVRPLLRFDGDLGFLRVLEGLVVATESLDRERHRLIAFDVAARRTVWSSPLERLPDAVVLIPGRAATLGEADSTVRVRDLATGEVAWARELVGPCELVDADSFGLLLRFDDRLVHLERDEGRETAIATGAGPRYSRLVGDRVLSAQREQVELLDRWTSERQWREPLDPCDAIDFCLAGEHLWKAMLHGRVLSIEARSVADGSLVGHWQRADEPFRGLFVRAIPFDGAVVVVVTGEERVRLVSFAQAP